MKQKLIFYLISLLFLFLFCIYLFIYFWQISLADIIVFVTTGDLLADRNTDYYLEVKEPKLKAFIERMKSLPQIDAWMKKRPQTDRVFSVKIQ